MFGLVLSIINSVALVLAGLFLYSYLPSYMKTKGANLASKEDLAELTSLVEEVKAEYASQLETLKSDLASEGQIVERRRRVYEATCSALRIFQAGHDNSETAKLAFHEAYSSAWLWASDDVLCLLNHFIGLQIEVAASAGSVPQQELKQAYADVMLAMRRDVGFRDTSMDSGDFHFVQF